MTTLVDEVLATVKKIDSINEEVGIRAFVWNVEKSVDKILPSMGVA